METKTAAAAATAAATALAAAACLASGYGCRRDQAQGSESSGAGAGPALKPQRKTPEAWPRDVLAGEQQDGGAPKTVTVQGQYPIVTPVRRPLQVEPRYRYIPSVLFVFSSPLTGVTIGHHPT
jgi:hypothetical protein